MENTPIDDLSNVVLDKQMQIRLEKLGRDVAMLQGRREAMNSRETELTSKVGAAKGRMSMKAEMEEALEALQKMAHERSVGAFERMLTAITHDVKKDDRTKIRLELTTERSMPALDITAEVGGEPEEITSGALANITSTGLRFITLARSGRSRFILLDESDCFVENNNVEAFFEVVDQLSRDAGIQALVITHHDISAFQDRFRIYNIEEVDSEDKWPRRIPELVSKGRMEPSEFQDQHFSFIEAQNFESYTRARIDLSPGVTAITGKNGNGKSAWARMLRGAFLGESTDGNIRHGQTMTGVNIGISDGRVLTHNRRKKGAPKGEFIMHTAESYEYSCENPTTWKKDEFAPRPMHHTETARLPEWVTAETQVGPVDGINVALWNQLDPVFMLNEPPSKRASLLSVGRESGHLFAMNEIYKDDLRNDNLAIREGEKELGAIKAVQEMMVPLDELVPELDTLTKTHREIAEEAQALIRGYEVLNEIETAQAELANINGFLAAASTLPTEPEIERTEGLTVWLDRVDQAMLAIAEKMDFEVPELPVLEPTEEILNLISTIQESSESAAMLGKTPVMPALPVIEDTELGERLYSDILQYTQDSKIEHQTMPNVPGLMDTRDLEQLIESIESAKEACALPRLDAPAAPVLDKTDDLIAWLDEYTRIQSLLSSCKAQTELLQTQSRELDAEVEKATEVLGANFTLPGDRIERIAEKLVHSTTGQGANQKVLCVMDEIQQQLTSVAREGYAYGLTDGLEQAAGTKLSKEASAEKSATLRVA